MIEKITNSEDNVDLRKFNRFIEELTWLLSMYSNMDFKNMPKVYEKYIQNINDNIVNKTNINYYPTREISDRELLVGILPRLFTDSVVFPTNEDIAQFARAVMGINIPRYSKKSRYELIGHIVCNADRADENSINALSLALKNYVKKGTEAREFIMKRKQALFKWNDIIQELAKGTID